MAGPSFPRVLRAAALIGAAPALVLLALLAGGHVAPKPGAAGLLACAAAALLLGRVWIGDLARLAEALRRAAAEDGRVPEAAARAPLLPAVREVADGVSRLARNLAERGELVGRLRRADEAIVEGLPDPLLVLSPNRAPLRANAAARTLFATGEGAERLGGDVAALLRHPALADAVDRALAERKPQAADLVLPVPVPRELLAQVMPMEPALADGGRIVVLLSDRTRERAVERMRADFVANASHELRTPLASLIGFIETLRGPAEDDPAARARFLAIMAEQSERMRRLIDDLLGLSRIELTEHQPPVGRAPLAEIAHAEAAALEPLLRGRRMTLTEALDEAAVAAPADADQLAQVVRNLLENAVRHGRDAGEVRLSVARAEAGGRPGVALTVADDGPGIPREHIPRLTERFYRVDRGRSRAAGGTGLGLAIVKHIVNRHRGQLAIESEEGAGARFRVWLPAAPPLG
ncbi:MAG: Phosphate regulon sensor protein PhoR (SphS) [uncultured Acetobacteraceae bacterium]|jgi:two-component system phosphate regulon sensor histidine kinase PhoR|uniref:histidine kinase n=1 Tax=uncultured Acetobacteraceae bacterium TaxID=169975 RepID=A0A6J4H767_9PROT|nr:MAG: Phosphate regulon sensor protein PhoR (SphS) [uncultured Acetobacteraceae bacterium]